MKHSASHSAENIPALGALLGDEGKFQGGGNYDE
jgi:hypothetical protein